jgi:hypothetical protein
LLAYWALNPWPSPDGFAGLVDRYREICFDEIACNAPKPDERAVFDTVADRLPSYTEPVLRAPRTAPG